MSDRPPCPYCRRRLREVPHRNVHVDVCDCGGMWFDAGEIEKWARGSERPRQFPQPDDPFEAGPFRCPRCRLDSLQSRVTEGVHFARCDRCAGIWLTPEGVSRLDPAFRPERGPGAVGSLIETILNILVGLSW